jgi:hypothetical protein
MIDIFESIPGWLIEHWFVGAVALIVFLSVGYVILLKIFFAAEDVRDIKRRRR